MDMSDILIIPDRTEITWGRRYLLFELVFLGSLLNTVALLLQIPIGILELNVIYFTINFLVVIILCRHFLLRTARYTFKHPLKCLRTALIWFIAYQALATVVGMVIVQLMPDFSNVNDESISDISQGNFYLMSIGTVLLVPLTEEILYRGILFGGLYRRNKIVAFAVSITVFSLVHVSGYIGVADPLTLALCFLQYLPAGFCLAMAYVQSGSLLPSVLIHMAVNCIGMLSMR